MRKKKIVIVVTAAVILLALLVVLAIYGLNSINQYNATIFDNTRDTTSVSASSSGEFDWREHNVNISRGVTDETRYYTNCEGDYVEDIYFYASESQDVEYLGNTGTKIIIEYDSWFNVFDDLEIKVVFSNGYEASDICHVPLGDNFVISYEDTYNYDLLNQRIVKVYVRTID